MIDIHSHIISGIDDGSKDEAMSLKMLQKAVASGTTSIFATSHLLQAAHEAGTKPTSQTKEGLEFEFFLKFQSFYFA